MKAAILQLGDDRKHFVGVTSEAIEKGSTVLITRIPNSQDYRLDIVEPRKVNMAEENLAAFWIPDWILEGQDQPPAKQTTLFDTRPQYE